MNANAGTVIACQQLTKNVRERPARRLLDSIHRTTADTQSKTDAPTSRQNPPQFLAGSSQTQMSSRHVASNWQSNLSRELQSMPDDELLANHSLQVIGIWKSRICKELQLMPDDHSV
jgi:hypothetical protein